MKPKTVKLTTATARRLIEAGRYVEQQPRSRAGRGDTPSIVAPTFNALTTSTITARTGLTKGRGTASLHVDDGTGTGALVAIAGAADVRVWSNFSASTPSGRWVVVATVDGLLQLLSEDCAVATSPPPPPPPPPPTPSSPSFQPMAAAVGGSAASLTSSGSYAEAGSWSDGPLDGAGNPTRTTPAGSGSLVATWRFGPASPGATYEVQAAYVPAPTNATDATYRLFDGTVAVAQAEVNQTLAATGPVVAGQAFRSLGTIVPAGDSIQIQLDNFANGTVSAGTIRVVTTALAPAGTGP